MKLTPDELKQINLELKAARKKPDDQCPGEEDLLRAAERKLREADRQEIVLHLRSCSDCVQKYRIIHSTRAWSNSAAEMLGVPRSRPSLVRQFVNAMTQRPALAAASIGLLLVFSIGTVVMLRGGFNVQNGSGERNGVSEWKLQVSPPDKATLESSLSN